MQAAEHLASSCLLLLNKKPEAEKLEIIASASDLSERLWDVAAQQSPLVVALALLTALRVHDKFLQQRAKEQSQ